MRALSTWLGLCRSLSRRLAFLASQANPSHPPFSDRRHPYALRRPGSVIPVILQTLRHQFFPLGNEHEAGVLSAGLLGLTQQLLIGLFKLERIAMRLRH